MPGRRWPIRSMELSSTRRAGRINITIRRSDRQVRTARHCAPPYSVSAPSIAPRTTRRLSDDVQRLEIDLRPFRMRPKVFSIFRTGAGGWGGIRRVVLCRGDKRASLKRLFRSCISTLCKQKISSLISETADSRSGKRDSDPRPQPWQGCALKPPKRCAFRGNQLSYFLLRRFSRMCFTMFFALVKRMVKHLRLSTGL